jgi:hypothetical protein
MQVIINALGLGCFQGVRGARLIMMANQNGEKDGGIPMHNSTF